MRVHYTPTTVTLTDLIAPSLTWSNPADIVYGTALSSTQLNATADVPGTFTYNVAAGAVLNAGGHTLEVTFTPEDAAKVACPVYGFYAENDERVDATISKAEELMRAAGKTYEPVIYKGAGHGFMRSGEPANSNMREGDKKARDEAWARWKTLLKQL